MSVFLISEGEGFMSLFAAYSVSFVGSSVSARHRDQRGSFFQMRCDLD